MCVCVCVCVSVCVCVCVLCGQVGCLHVAMVINAAGCENCREKSELEKQRKEIQVAVATQGRCVNIIIVIQSNYINT